MKTILSMADSDELLTLLAEGVNDQILLGIAQADCGLDVDKHLESLRRIRAGQFLINPRESFLFPLEVIELTRWSTPGNPVNRLPNVHDAHLARAFCCSLMLRIGGEPLGHNYVYDGDGNHTLIQLVDSIDALGSDYQLAALRFIAWRLTNSEQCFEDLPYFILTVLYLYLNITQNPSLEILESLAREALLEEARVRGRFLLYVEPGWLLPLTLMNLKHDAWQQLFGRLARLIEFQHPDMTSDLYELQVCLDA